MQKEINLGFYVEEKQNLFHNPQKTHNYKYQNVQTFEERTIPEIGL